MLMYVATATGRVLEGGVVGGIPARIVRGGELYPPLLLLIPGGVGVYARVCVRH